MTKKKIEELYRQHLHRETDCYGTYVAMDILDFTQALNQAELEWYKKLEKNLCSILDDNDIACDLYNYHKEIKNKIKELENEN